MAHLKILTHGIQGFPGVLIRKEDGAPASWTASSVSGVGYVVTYNFSKPFSMAAGKTYWFGLSGNGFDLQRALLCAATEASLTLNSIPASAGAMHAGDSKKKPKRSSSP